MTTVTLTPREQALFDFLFEHGKNDSGVSYDEVLLFDNKQLEETHDFIQWVFPNEVASSVLPDAPILTENLVAAMRRVTSEQGERFNERQTKMVERMMDFWSSNREFFRPSDHNHLRATRLIKFTVLIGDEFAAKMIFFSLVKMVAAAHAHLIETVEKMPDADDNTKSLILLQASKNLVGAKTISYWSDALSKTVPYLKHTVGAEETSSE